MGVALFTLGGTIAMAGHARGGDTGPVVTRLNGAQLTAAVPGLTELGVALDIHDVDAVPSANLTFADVLALVGSASQAVRGLVNGGLLDPYKARILLRLLLASGADQETITAAFIEHG